MPFAEDLWKDLCFLNPSGPVEMSIVKPCARCTVPVVDPEKGEFYADKAGINKLIQSFRSGAKIGLTKEKWHREVGCSEVNEAVIIVFDTISQHFVFIGSVYVLAGFFRAECGSPQ